MTAFCISSSQEFKAIAGLISIHFHLDKLIGYYYLGVVFLSKQYILNSFLDIHYSKQADSYYIATNYLTSKQYLKTKSPIVNNNTFNQVLLAFDSLNKELFL